MPTHNAHKISHLTQAVFHYSLDSLRCGHDWKLCVFVCVCVSVSISQCPLPFHLPFVKSLSCFGRNHSCIVKCVLCMSTCVCWCVFYLSLDSHIFILLDLGVTYLHRRQ